MAKDIKLGIIINQSGNAKSGLASLASGVGKLGGVAAGLATGGLLLAVGGVVALGKGLFDSVGAAMEAQEGQAQLEAVLKSTNGAAGMTTESINALASSLQAVTPFSDDAILAGQNLLLTFTNIGKDVFPAATATVLDMATALGTDTTSAAMQLGKALNDPIAGISALTRVGVSFTDAQKDQIKAMVEMGDTAGAQQIILAELNKEFGGSAVAAGETLPGKLAILKNTFGDIQETIGAAFLPALSSIADAFSSGLKSEFVQNALANLTGFITGTLVPGFDEIVSKVGMIITAFQGGGLLAAFKVFDDGSSRVSAIAEVLGFTETQAMALGATIQSVAKFVTDAMVIWNEWSSHLSETTGPAMLLIQDALDRISIATGGATGEFSLSKTALAALKATLDAITIAIKLVAIGFQAAAWYVETWSRILRTAKALVDGFRGAISSMSSGVSSAINSVVGAFNRMADAARRAANAVPSWLRPGSPTPFEIGLRGIAGAAKGVASAMPGMLEGVGGQGSGVGAVTSSPVTRPLSPGPLVINFTYSPVISLADRFEAENVLAPFIANGVRVALAGGKH